LITWNLDKGINNMKTFGTRALAEKAFDGDYAAMPRIILSGETGDVLMSNGDQNQLD
jgi:hypothetical protein